MNNIAEFDKKFYGNFAKKFVDLYEQEGSHIAGVYAVEHVRKENMDSAQPYVRAEFSLRGYEFDDE